MRVFALVFIAVFLSFSSSFSSWAGSKSDIDKSVCKYFISHEYKSGSGAEYKAGVDVHGKPVIEADIIPSVITIPDEYSFPLKIDTAKYMGLNIPKGLLGEGTIGTIKINNKTGEVTFNGEPIEGNAQKLLKELCVKHSK